MRKNISGARVYIILFCSIILFYMLLNSTKSRKEYEYTKTAQEIMDIDFTNDKIYVEHEIDFRGMISDIGKEKDDTLYYNLMKSQYRKSDTIDFYFYLPFDFTDFEFIDFKTNINVNYKYYISNNAVLHFAVPEDEYQLLIDELERNDYKLKISYSSTIINIIKITDPKANIVRAEVNKYSGLSKLKIHLNDSGFEPLKFQFNLKEESDGTYRLRYYNLKPSIKLKANFDTHAKVIEEYSYMKEKILSLLFYVSSTITIIIFIIIIALYIAKKIHIPKGEYERNTENIIDPIFAESVIDGKININNLVITCLINMISKKNLENIDNDRLKLINVSNINEIEESILKLLFLNNDNNLVLKDFIGKTIKISDLNKNIIKNKKLSRNINETFINIRKKIKEKMTEIDIIDSNWNFILRCIRNIIKFIIASIIIISAFTAFLPIYAAFYFMIYVVYIFIFYSDTDIDLKIGVRSAIQFFIIFSMISIICSISYHNLMMKYLVLLIINIVLFRFTNTYIFTLKGREEYKKAYKLKKYLIDYSLINQRDIDGVIVYDEYLVYATAFGITSNITKKINENLVELNLIVKKINKLMSFDFLFYNG